MNTEQTHTYKNLLDETTQYLRDADIHSARLDAEILLAHTLGVERTWLVAHGDEELNSKQAKEFEQLIERRLQREPIAYLVGHKEFYGREFKVTPDVLIPRPETESLIDTAAELLKKVPPFEKRAAANLKIIDVGTGSGCVGITLKLEQPELAVTLSDISLSALDVARENAQKLGAKVEFVQSDLLESFSKIKDLRSKIYNAVVANLPYVDKAWQRSPETDHEPALALFAEDYGLELIKKLIEQSITLLVPNGYLLLEADPEQHTSIVSFAKNLGFSHAKTQDYALALRLM